MTATPNPYLVAGAALSAVAALLHLACIVFGPRWYRFFGAGERMIQMAANGDWRPVVVTLFIATVLSVWSLYALAGAGLVPALPFTRLALCGITAVYLSRAVAFPFLRPYFSGNSRAFWFWSSTICLGIGVLHLIGLVQVWQRL